MSCWVTSTRRNEQLSPRPSAGSDPQGFAPSMTELAPGSKVKTEIGGDDGNRTRVRGFADTSGACVSIRQRPRFVLNPAVLRGSVRRRCYQPLLPETTKPPVSGSAAPATLPCRTRVVVTSGVIGQVALDPLHEPGSRVVGAVALMVPFVSPRAQTRQGDRLAVAEQRWWGRQRLRSRGNAGS